MISLKEVEKFLRFIFRPKFLEIRIISQGDSKMVKSLFFESPDDAIAFLRMCCQQGKVQNSKLEECNFYYGILPRNGEKGDKQHVEDWVEFCWLDIDVFSFKKPDEYKNLTKDEIKQKCVEKWNEIKSILEGHGIQPSAIVYTGRGVQPIIRLSQPVTKKEVEELNLRLIHIVEDNTNLKIDHAIDCSRVLRLPGFPNVKELERPLPTDLIEFNPDATTDVGAIRKLPLPKKKSRITQGKKKEEWRNEFGIPLEAIRQIDTKLDELLKGPVQLDYPTLSEADQATIAKLWFWRFTGEGIAGILRQFRTREKLERDDYLELSFSKVVGGERFHPARHTRVVKKLAELGYSFKAIVKKDDLKIKVYVIGEEAWFEGEDGSISPKVRIGKIDSVETQRNVIEAV